MKSEIDSRKIIIFFIIIITSVAISYFVQPLIQENEKAIDLIINVFSILAGFLIAIMTIFSDFSVKDNTNWRDITLQKRTISIRATRNKMLFYCYLLVLAFIFISILFSKSTIEWHKTTVTYTQYIYIFLASIAFIYSMLLPNKIHKLQQEKFDLLLENKKPKALKY